MILRRLAAAILAVPVIVRLYVPAMPTRRIGVRIVAAFAVVGIGALGAIALMPRAGTASPPTPIEPIPVADFVPLLADRELDAPATITFSAPMDRSSVRSALDVSPPAEVVLNWDAAGRILTVRPAANWAAGTSYDVSVGAAAKSRAGRQLGKPTHVTFLTRPATTGKFEVVLNAAGLLRGDATIGLRFDRPVDVASATAGLVVDPPLAGTLAPATSGAKNSEVFTFTPAAPLPGSTAYTVSLGGTVVDEDGGVVGAVAQLHVTTVTAPSIVRNRPSGGAKAVAADALLSIRFSEAMDRTSTTAALSVTSGGKPIAGKVTWYERDTVVGFDPTAKLPAGATVGMVVTSAARSAEGSALVRPLAITFTVAKPPPPKPAPKPAAKTTATKPAPKPAPKPVTPPPPSGGAAAGSAPWYAVETYYLRLMNCTRTGGWVTSGGACGSVPGGLSVRPPAKALVIDAGISNKVTRPYAKYLAVNGLCNHFYGGSPADRLRRAGYTSYRWGENIGCPSGNPNAGMIAVERFFQNETPSGGHYVNLMNPAYDRAGIGVWVSSSRVRVVIDFYHP